MASGDSNENDVNEDVNSTDNDKAAGSSSGSNNYSGKSIFLSGYYKFRIII